MKYIEITAARRKDFTATRQEIKNLRIALNKEASRKEFYFLIKDCMIKAAKKAHKSLYKEDVEKHLTEIYRKGMIQYIKDHEKDLKGYGVYDKVKKFINIEKRHYDAPFDPKIEQQIDNMYKLLEKNSL